VQRRQAVEDTFRQRRPLLGDVQGEVLAHNVHHLALAVVAVPRFEGHAARYDAHILERGHVQVGEGVIRLGQRPPGSAHQPGELLKGGPLRIGLGVGVDIGGQDAAVLLGGLRRDLGGGVAVVLLHEQRQPLHGGRAEGQFVAKALCAGPALRTAVDQVILAANQGQVSQQLQVVAQVADVQAGAASQAADPVGRAVALPEAIGSQQIQVVEQVGSHLVGFGSQGAAPAGRAGVQTQQLIGQPFQVAPDVGEQEGDVAFDQGDALPRQAILGFPGDGLAVVQHGGQRDRGKLERAGHELDQVLRGDVAGVDRQRADPVLGPLARAEGSVGQQFQVVAQVAGDAHRRGCGYAGPVRRPDARRLKNFVGLRLQVDPDIAQDGGAGRVIVAVPAGRAHARAIDLIGQQLQIQPDIQHKCAEVGFRRDRLFPFALPGRAGMDIRQRRRKERRADQQHHDQVWRQTAHGVGSLYSTESLRARGLCSLYSDDFKGPFEGRQATSPPAPLHRKNGEGNGAVTERHAGGKGGGREGGRIVAPERTPALPLSLVVTRPGGSIHRLG